MNVVWDFFLFQTFLLKKNDMQSSYLFNEGGAYSLLLLELKKYIGKSKNAKF